MIAERAAYLGITGPLIIAHRGGAAEVAENSRLAFSHVETIGVQVVESDVQATKDGVVIIMHDSKFDRTTDNRGKVSSYTFSQLEKVHDVSGDQPPTLEDMLKNHPNLRFNIDVKSDNALKPFIALMHKLQVADRLNVASFSTKRIKVLRRELPQMSTSMGTSEIVRLILASYCPKRWWSRLTRSLPGVEQNVNCVQIPNIFWGFYPVASKRLVDLIHLRGQQVHVWTVNSLPRMRQLLGWGVDGLVTDIPTQGLQLLKEKQ